MQSADYLCKYRNNLDIAMKKGLLLLTALLCLASVAQAKGANDPVLMTVAGKPVTLSEVEYL